MYFTKDSPDQIQHVLNIKQKDRNLEIKEKANKQTLTDDQKEAIMRCIRYPFLPQDALLKMSTDPDFTLGKELIVQGLAVKLGGTHAVANEDLKINIKPRTALGIVSEEFPIGPGEQQLETGHINIQPLADDQMPFGDTMTKTGAIAP